MEETSIETYQQRVNRLDEYVSALEKSLQEMKLKTKEAGQLTSFDQPLIEAHLCNDPDMIADTGILLARFQRAYEYSKLTTQTIQAEIWRQCNEEKDERKLTSAKDREAWVKTQPRLIEALKQEIEWKYNLERMKVINERYQNLFVGVRKLASLIPEQNQIQDQAQKYI